MELSALNPRVVARLRAMRNPEPEETTGAPLLQPDAPMAGVAPWSDDPETSRYLKEHPEIAAQAGVPPPPPPPAPPPTPDALARGLGPAELAQANAETAEPPTLDLTRSTTPEGQHAQDEAQARWDANRAEEANPRGVSSVPQHLGPEELAQANAETGEPGLSGSMRSNMAPEAPPVRRVVPLAKAGAVPAARPFQSLATLGPGYADQFGDDSPAAAPGAPRMASAPPPAPMGPEYRPEALGGPPDAPMGADGGSSSPAGMAAKAMMGAGLSPGAAKLGLSPRVADYLQQRQQQGDPDMDRARTLSLVLGGINGIQHIGDSAGGIVSALTDGRVNPGRPSAAEYAQRDATAAAPVNNLLARRAAAKAHEADDPDSEESVKARESFKAMMPSLAGKLAGFDRFTKNDIKGGSAQWMKANQEIITQTRNANKDQRQTDLDKKHADDEAARTKERAGDRFDRRRHEGVVEAHMKEMEGMADQRNDRQNKALGLKTGPLEVTGVEFDDSTHHTAKEATALRAKLDTVSRLDDSLGLLESEFKKHGAQIAPTEAKRVMEYARAKSIPLINQLEGMAPGMPQGHQHNLEAQLQEQLTAGNVVNPEAYLRVIRQIREDAHRAVDSNVRSLGGHRAGGGTSASSGGPTSGPVRMVNPDGQPWEMDAAEVPDALAHGWKRGG